MKKTDDQIKQQNDEQQANNSSEIEEWKHKYMRALADYNNLERRTREEKDEIRTFAAEIILTKMLPVVDSFSRVKEHVKDQGVDLTYKQLMSILEELGVEKLDVIGKQFNPHEMECIEVVDGNENEVVSEVLPGYRFRDKIIRVAHVNVGKGKGTQSN